MGEVLIKFSGISYLRQVKLCPPGEKFKKEKAIYLCLNNSCEKCVEQKDSWVKYHFPLSRQHILLQNFSFWTLCNFLYFPGDCLEFQWWYYFAEIFPPTPLQYNTESDKTKTCCYWRINICLSFILHIWQVLLTFFHINVIIHVCTSS